MTLVAAHKLRLFPLSRLVEKMFRWRARLGQIDVCCLQTAPTPPSTCVHEVRIAGSQHFPEREILVRPELVSVTNPLSLFAPILDVTLYKEDICNTLTLKLIESVAWHSGGGTLFGLLLTAVHEREQHRFTRKYHRRCTADTAPPLFAIRSFPIQLHGSQRYVERRGRP